MKKIAVVTLLYIAAPSFIFLIFWLRPSYAFLTSLCLTAALVMAIGHLKSDQETSPEIHPLPVLCSSALLAFGICLFSEFGAIDYQSFDYQIHNYKLNLLATQDLPLYNEARGVHMCYYLGYYIIPALLGKYLSLGAIKWLFFVWSWIGLSLTFAWVQLSVIRFPHRQRILICLALLIGSYVCLLLPAAKWLFPALPVESGNTLAIGGIFLLNQIPLLTRGLSESTQHTLPALLGICFLLAVWEKPAYFYALSFFLLATLFLTPFAGIGLLPFLLVAFFKHLSKIGMLFFRKMIFFSTPLVIAFLPVLLFLVSSEATDMNSNRTIWQAGTPLWWFYYLIYLFSTYGVWLLLFGKELFLFSRSAILVSIVFIPVISLFQIGYYNDLHIRSTTVPQAVFGISIAYVLVTRFDLVMKKKILTLAFVFWCMNSVSPFKFFYDRIFVLEGQRNTIEHPEIAGIRGDYYDLLEKTYQANSKEVVKQYSMRKDSFFEKYLIKKLE